MDYMKLAIKEANKALNKGEVPVGCVIVKNDEVISKSYNNRQKQYIVIGHAEVNAIIKAEKKVNDWRLDGCVMYVTLCPCKMCKTIIEESRIDKVYYLLNNDKNDLDTNKYVEYEYNDEEKIKYIEKFKNFFDKLRI